ncbi:MAG: hypothetical protein A3J42_02635 [Candidatus Dadabacteria bacterium RIFCSPHIGHO2_12_FULL_53_21]|nr:MAG: hypothetical protein A3J42_02635 [Candidatus Dadabacteria bacterium RIFCSPHIGHO2_12_FULL_53_21]
MEQRVTDRGSIKTALFLFLAIFALSFAVYFLTREDSPTPFNNFVRLADAFLHGRLYLTSDVSWLEIAPFDGKYYIVPPPFPAFLILPVVAVFGLSTNQTLISIFFGSLNVSLAFLAARALSKSRSVQLWTAAMFGFGTIHWWVATTGGVWTFSHTVSATLLFAAILLTLYKSRPFFTGAALGASYWTRLPTILSLPFFVAMYADEWYRRGGDPSLYKRVNLRPLIWLGAGTGIFILLNTGYNMLRFNTPFDISYYLIPGILDEPWFQKGIFDFSYIPRNLKVIFGGFPKFIDGFPYVTPSWSGMAIWITTPAFIYALFAGIRNKLAIGCWLSILLVATANFCHGTWGFSQFGYRFAMDFYPFLFLLTVRGIGNDIRWHHKVLISIGILVNLWGVLWINKFGWVSY